MNAHSLETAAIGFTTGDMIKLADGLMPNARLIELLHKSTDRICELELKLQASEAQTDGIVKLFRAVSALAQEGGA